MARITIFHTSDIHDKLKPHAAECLQQLKADNPDAIFLDSGDSIRSGNIFWRPGGERVFDLMNQVPYDAMCIGNREFHFLGVGMDAKTKNADFPFLSANLRRSSKNTAMPAVPFIKTTRDGLRVAVMGLSVPCVTEQMMVQKISTFYFDQPFAVAPAVVKQLRGKCDLLVALTHIGIKKDIELAKIAPGIDLILGGHTHTLTEETLYSEKTRIIHSGCFAKRCSKIDIDFTGERIEMAHEYIDLPTG